MPNPQTIRAYTVFIRQANRQGTMFITKVDAPTIAKAKTKALKDCSACWGPEYAIEVVGVALGDVELIEWDDE